MIDQSLSNIVARLRGQIRLGGTRSPETTQYYDIYVTYDQKEAMKEGD